MLVDVQGEGLRVGVTSLGAWWPFRLEHRFGMLGVGDAQNRPAWRVSLSAEALHVEGAARVVGFWRDVIGALTGASVLLLVSRLDVHADFAELGIADQDRAAFVCRSHRQSVEFAGEAMETLYFGKGGRVTVRVYDKLAELRASGKGAYLLGAYEAAGWRPGDSVQRVEAQVRRDVLRELNVTTADDALRRAGAVYGYVVGKWLRLVDPGTATRAERAALDPRWRVVQTASIAAGIDPGRRIARRGGTPGLDVIVANVVGWALNAAALMGCYDLGEVMGELAACGTEYLADRGRDFGGEVRTRRLEFRCGTPSLVSSRDAMAG